MSGQDILWLYGALFLVYLAIDLALDYLNIRQVIEHAGEVPPPFRSLIDEHAYARSVQYTLTKARFGMLTTLYSAGAVFFILTSGLLGWLDQRLQSFELHPYVHGIAYVLAIMLFFTLISAPLSLYSNFVIEQQFGFNKTTLKLWILDQIKGLALGSLLLAPVLVLLFWFVDTAGEWWWLFGFLSVTAFEMILIFVYPRWIAPWFNTFSELEQGSLRERIIALAEKLGFHTAAIFVMDGSKRSAHANAYFTGFGRNKRIVLFDTLMQQLQEDEVLAVLAHEIGHQKKHHIKKLLALNLLIGFIGFWILGRLIEYAPFFEAFGVSRPSTQAALVIFTLVSAPVMFFLSPLINALSRKHEYEADEYAKRAVGSAEPLVQGLLQLSKNSLSNLTPHPWYSFFHYSHPTLAERFEALGSGSERGQSVLVSK